MEWDGILMSDFKFYLQELNSEECACGAWKKKRLSFCYTCYRALSKDMQKDLYQRMGEGYEEAYDDAIRWLREEGRLE
jgi:hypothetical protein